MIDDHVRGAQLGSVVVHAVNRDVAVRMEPVAARHAPGGDSADFAVHHRTIEQRDNGRERANPAQGFGRDRGGAPALRLGPGERADDRGNGFSQHVGSRAARLFGHGEQHAVALNQLVCGQASLAQEPFKRLRRRTDARALHFLADGSGRGGQIARDQRQTARGGPHGDFAQRDARVRHCLAEQLFQIGARTGLHPRGDFFRAQFEKKIAHTVHPGNLASHSGVFFSIHA